MGYVAWACKFLNVDTDWKSLGVSQALKGANQRELRLFGGAKRIEVLLDNDVVQKLVKLTDEPCVNDGFQVLTLLSWEFLLRVKSEGIELKLGTPLEAQQGALPEGRHSAVWISALKGYYTCALKGGSTGPKAHGW